jgi:hypothetical protein
MTFILDKREEGLRALAHMIAAAYRRRMTSETGMKLTGNSDEAYPHLKTQQKQNTEPRDLRREGEYFEIIGVDNFIRNKKQQVNTTNKHNKLRRMSNVTNKGNIRNRKAAQVGQDKAGNQEEE